MIGKSQRGRQGRPTFVLRGHEQDDDLDHSASQEHAPSDDRYLSRHRKTACQPSTGTPAPLSRLEFVHALSAVASETIAVVIISSFWSSLAHAALRRAFDSKERDIWAKAVGKFHQEFAFFAADFFKASIRFLFVDSRFESVPEFVTTTEVEI